MLELFSRENILRVLSDPHLLFEQGLVKLKLIEFMICSYADYLALTLFSTFYIKTRSFNDKRCNLLYKRTLN